MIQINLKDFYPELYTNDYLVEVPQEVFDFLIENNKQDKNYKRLIKYYRANCRLENIPVTKTHKTTDTVLDLIELRADLKRLDLAMGKLTPVQRRRLYMRYSLNMSYSEIAKIECVSYKAATKSILLAQEKLRKELIKQ